MRDEVSLLAMDKGEVRSRYFKVRPINKTVSQFCKEKSKYRALSLFDATPTPSATFTNPRYTSASTG